MLTIESGEKRLLRAIFTFNPSENFTYREPGAGAIEFGEQFTHSMSQDEAAKVIAQLLAGKLHDTTDSRVKRCDYCGYFWRDESLRNTRKTCSDECKRKIKTLQRRKQREKEKKELMNTKPKKRKLQDDYVYWLEYPYWNNEYSMLKIGWKFEKPHEIKTLDFIDAKNEIYGVGNRRKPKRIVEYYGDKQDEF